MRLLTLIVNTLFLTLMLQACSLVFPWMDEEGGDVVAAEEAVEDEPEKKRSSKIKIPDSVGRLTMTDLERKQAQLWARMDELNQHVKKQREKIKVLEKGLILGMPSEDLARQSEEVDQKPLVMVQPETIPKVEDNKLIADSTTPKIDLSSDPKFKAAFADAHDLYRQGRYGRAIVSFSKLVEEYPGNDPNGLVRYWVAKSWFALKEYDTAKDHLSRFVENFPESTWAARAKLLLAKAEFRLGLRETAMERLRGVIKDYPYEEASEMARLEIEHIRKAL